MARVAGVRGDGSCSPLDSVSVYRVQVREGAAHDALCSFNHPCQLFPLLCRAAAIPHGHTEAEDAFYCRSVEVHEQTRGESSPFQFPGEEEPLLGLLHQAAGVQGPGEMLTCTDPVFVSDQTDLLMSG